VKQLGSLETSKVPDSGDITMSGKDKESGFDFLKLKRKLNTSVSPKQQNTDSATPLKNKVNELPVDKKSSKIDHKEEPGKAQEKVNLRYEKIEKELKSKAKGAKLEEKQRIKEKHKGERQRAKFKDYEKHGISKGDSDDEGSEEAKEGRESNSQSEIESENDDETPRKEEKRKSKISLKSEEKTKSKSTVEMSLKEDESLSPEKKPGGLKKNEELAREILAKNKAKKLLY